METIHTKGKSKKNRPAPLHKAIEQAVYDVLSVQREGGYWCYELEADCTIPAEYIMMMHFMDEIDEELQQKMAVYLRRRQNESGGWPLYYGGETDLSCSVKAYYALKLAGDSPDDLHMNKARKVILSLGGAAKSNVFTRIALALFEQLPWRGVPFIPVEIMTFPRWFPFHLKKVSYWSRTVMVPLFILCSLKAKARNPQDTGIRELFVRPPDEEKNYFKMRSPMNRTIFLLERIGFRLERFIPETLRKQALEKAWQWFVARLNGVDGLGAIFPAMVNAYEALDLLGYREDHPLRVRAREALQKLLVVRDDEAYCQPCVSPVWDTLLAAAALDEAEDLDSNISKALDSAASWLIENQLSDEPGDWRDEHPRLEGGGWPFQFKNDYYPDLDDTAFAAYVLHKIDPVAYRENILRAARWLKGMQSRSGGFAAFDSDNTCYYLNEIPFADHGALLDPPSVDVSARCLMLFGLLVEEYPEFRDSMDRCLAYISREQEDDGSWFGRWGTNYVYGTWSVLAAFETAGISKNDPRIRRAVAWLKKKQRADGGWGEDNWSYHEPGTRGEANRSTAFQTAWALLGLLAAGEADSESVRKGIGYLTASKTEDGLWYDPEFTAPGFPRVFYLKYHGYDKYFPLWALARYRQEQTKPGTEVPGEFKAGIVVAMPQELETLVNPKGRQGHSVIHHSDNILICLSGIGAQNAKKASKKLLEHGADRLISWGTAASLTADVRPGTLIVPDKILTKDLQTIETDAVLRSSITELLSQNGSIITTDTLCETQTFLVDEVDKSSLAKHSKAKAADMETGAIARMAREHNISFLVIRAVSDSADMSIPDSILKNLNSDMANISGMISHTLLRPQDWFSTIRLAYGFGKARRSLDKASKIVLPYLAEMRNNIIENER